MIAYEKCPYCLIEQKIEIPEGFDNSESEIYQYECNDCGKMFTFIGELSFNCTTYKAPCLNGGNHKYSAKDNKLICDYCGDQK